MQGSVGQVLGTQAGYHIDGQPRAHIGQRRVGHVAQAFQHQQFGCAEKCGHFSGRFGARKGQHARLQGHAGLRELLVQAGGPLHQPAMFLLRGNRGGASAFALDQPFGGQRGKRLAHHAARDAKAFTQRGFAGQHGARRKLVRPDESPQQRRHLGVQRDVA
ncbi:hypothetical protein D3C87_1706140 [compost metagenome]